MRRERAAVANSLRATATSRAYASDWRDFERWCREAGRLWLPAVSDTVGLYLVDLARRGRAMATIARRVCAVGWHHLSAGYPSPVDDSVGEVLAGLRRRLGTAPRHAKAALRVDDLRLLVSQCDEDAGGVRDRAVLLVGFASSWRRSELAALDLSDVELVREGVQLHLGRSKTDQEGRGRSIGIPYGSRKATCPVRALRLWMSARGSWPGPLFSRVDLSGRVLSNRLRPAAIAEIVKRCSKRAGLDESRYAGHSLRAGFATAARRAGSLAIMERTGHRSEAMVLRYIRDGSLFDVDPLDGLL